MVSKTSFVLVVAALLSAGACNRNEHKSSNTTAAGSSGESGSGSEYHASTEGIEESKVYKNFAAWDKDRDGVLTEAEIDQGLVNSALDADGDGNGEIDDLEYATWNYKAWDTNGDEIVDFYEYRNGMSIWGYSGIAETSFRDWDADGDEELTVTEFVNGMRKHRVYDSVDTDGDGKVSAKEMGNARFTYWDTDNDGFIEHSEVRISNNQ
ncbi:MAG: EF-hand domain-containing protein [Polyangiales bacterium]